MTVEAYRSPALSPTRPFDSDPPDATGDVGELDALWLNIMLFFTYEGRKCGLIDLLASASWRMSQSAEQAGEFEPCLRHRTREATRIV